MISNYNVEDEKYPPPDWINFDFLTKVICNYEKSTAIQVKYIDIISETPKPIAYGSLIFRTIVDYRHENVNKSKSMLVKTMPESADDIKNFLGGAHFFETEFGMYTDVIPKFEQILRDTGDNTVLCRRCLYHSSSPRKVMVLEDLTPDGYSIPVDRDMTLEEVKTVYYKLAKWHAVSHKISLENPSYFDKYRYDFFCIPEVCEESCVYDGIDLFIELLDSVPTLNEYKPYFEAMRETFVSDCAALSEEYRKNPQKDGIYVLCHGDYNYKNFLLKNNPQTGQLEDALLVDMKVAYMGSIANDLINATFMLLDPKLREDHRDEIFYFYMSTFVQTLKKIGFTGRLPKIAEMREQIKQRIHLGLYLLTSSRPLMSAWFGKDVDQEKLIKSKDYRRQFYYSKDYIEELHKWLPRWLHVGLLEL